jgi:hypothetical protein
VLAPVRVLSFDRLTPATAVTTLHGMSLFPDLPPPTSPPAKPKLTPEE